MLDKAHEVGPPRGAATGGCTYTREVVLFAAPPLCQRVLTLGPGNIAPQVSLLQGSCDASPTKKSPARSLAPYVVLRSRQSGRAAVNETPQIVREPSLRCCVPELSEVGGKTTWNQFVYWWPKMRRCC